MQEAEELEERASIRRGANQHPGKELLLRFLRGDASRAEGQTVVRHLLKGCPECRGVTRQVWSLPEQPGRLRFDSPREHSPSQPAAVAPGRRLETPAAPALFPSPATRPSAYAEGTPQSGPRDISPWTKPLKDLPEDLREALTLIVRGLRRFRRIKRKRTATQSRAGHDGR
jgi:hypothetical protein